MRRAADALWLAGNALGELSTPAFHMVTQQLGRDWSEQLARLHDGIGRLSISLDDFWSRQQRRGRPKTEAREVAESVARVLAAHGIRPTTGPTGRFARVLRVMLHSLRISAGVEELVKAVAKSAR
jgi:hypothetical protein